MELRLNSLKANNPLGYFAALGLLVALDEEGVKLAWQGQPVPRAELTGVASEGEMLESVLSALKGLRESESLTSSIEGIDNLKVKPEQMRNYLRDSALDVDKGEPVLAMSLIAEGSYDGKGDVSKPTDLYFAAGQQTFLSNARDILDAAVDPEKLLPALTGHWKYDADVKSMGWDVRDNREHAYMAHDPTKKTTSPKLSNPEVEALALLGLTLYPVFGSSNRTLTTGCSGRWKGGSFSWPVWERPLPLSVVRTLVTQAHGMDGQIDRQLKNRLKGWGVTEIYESRISRSDQGGYGAFSPARVL